MMYKHQAQSNGISFSSIRFQSDLVQVSMVADRKEVIPFQNKNLKVG